MIDIAPTNKKFAVQMVFVKVVFFY